MKHSSKVSVIVPVYNGELTIERCIASVVNQTYRNFEIIMIDDGSTDKSGIICEQLCMEYSSEGYDIYVIHQENKGVSAARNAGISAAKGKYFVCVDCDDEIKELYLEKLVELQESDRGVGHVCCGFINCLEGGKEFVFSEKEEVSFVDRSDYMELYAKVMVQSPCIRLYDTFVVKSNDLRMRQELSLGEDLVFNLEYFDSVKNTKLGVINQGNYIYHNENNNSLNRKYRKNLVKEYEFLHEEIKKHLIRWGIFYGNVRSAYFNCAFNDYLIALDNTYDANNKITFIQKLRYNNKILRNAKFREALNNKNIYISPYLEMAYRSKSFLLVLIMKKVFKIKSVIWEKK